MLGVERSSKAIALARRRVDAAGVRTDAVMTLPPLTVAWTQVPG